MTRMAMLGAAVVCGAWITATTAANGADLVADLHQPAAMTSISGHFTLQTLDGREVTDAAYRGKWLLVYFGYTSCPDICPTTLLRVGQALQSLGPLAGKVQPIFITLDPVRDTRPRLTKYMAAFDARLIGLRGDSEQIREAARQFHVYYRLRSLGNGEYTVDHSSFLYVVGPDGHFAKLLADSVPADQLADELRQLQR